MEVFKSISTLFRAHFAKYLKEGWPAPVLNVIRSRAFLSPLIWSAASLAVLYIGFHAQLSYADGTSGGTLPGDSNVTGSMSAAGDLMRIVDVGLFKWGARVFAGLCIMSAGWALKEQRFGIAVICVIGAILFGTATKWVKDLFTIGGADSVFSRTEPLNPQSDHKNVARKRANPYA